MDWIHLAQDKDLVNVVHKILRICSEAEKLSAIRLFSGLRHACYQAKSGPRRARHNILNFRDGKALESDLCYEQKKEVKQRLYGVVLEF
jgi:hypothetical protein